MKPPKPVAGSMWVPTRIPEITIFQRKTLLDTLRFGILGNKLEKKQKLCFLSFASGFPVSGIFLVEVFVGPQLESPPGAGHHAIVVPLWRHALRSPHRVGSKTAEDEGLFGGAEDVIGTLLGDMIQNKGRHAIYQPFKRRKRDQFFWCNFPCGIHKSTKV